MHEVFLVLNTIMATYKFVIPWYLNPPGFVEQVKQVKIRIEGHQKRILYINIHSGLQFDARTTDSDVLDNPLYLKRIIFCCLLGMGGLCISINFLVVYSFYALWIGVYPPDLR